MEQANKLLTDNKEFREGLIKLTGAKQPEAGKESSLAFNTTNETNKKLLKGLIYILNNGYSNTINASDVEKTVYSQLGSTEIKGDTPLLGSQSAAQ